ncbi:lysophospholipase-like protein 1 [Littorina saxatilis]|uniref:palmitoyl-protein hydrolase n=1 Tax=Littorina saxatilis TaxID=31220 RepID=A0AAN9BIF4_9CAEN
MTESVAEVFSPIIIPPTGGKCTASVILLHGSKISGEDLRQSFKTSLGEELAFPHIRVVYPNAPPRPYSKEKGELRRVWFDRPTSGLEGNEDTQSVDAIVTKLGRLIDEEVKSGIPLDRIVIGGFSMGGTVAMHLGYRVYPQVAGVLVMGNFLYNDSSVYKALENKDGKDARLPPLQMYHAEQDEKVAFNSGKVTFNRLTSLGVKGQFIALPNEGHAMNPTMAKSVRDWIVCVLPE